MKRFVFALVFIIVFQLGTKAACFHADNGVQMRIEGWFTSKDFDGEGVFLEPLGFAGEGLLDHCFEQFSGSLGAPKGIRGKDLPEFCANGFGRKAIAQVRARELCHGWVGPVLRITRDKAVIRMILQRQLYLTRSTCLFRNPMYEM